MNKFTKDEKNYLKRKLSLRPLFYNHKKEITEDGVIISSRLNLFMVFLVLISILPVQIVIWVFETLLKGFLEMFDDLKYEFKIIKREFKKVKIETVIKK
jgi:hypothetical protein